jgi:hypothetical protein
VRLADRLRDLRLCYACQLQVSAALLAYANERQRLALVRLLTGKRKRKLRRSKRKRPGKWVPDRLLQSPVLQERANAIPKLSPTS